MSMAFYGKSIENALRILWIGPDMGAQQTEHFTIVSESSIEAGLLRVRNSRFDCIVVRLTAGDGCDAIELLGRESSPHTPVFAQLNDASVPVAALLAHSGAARVYGPDTAADDILHDALGYAHESHLCCAPGARPAWRKSIIGESEVMRRIGSLVDRVAARKSTVLITGESGTGKELVAAALHAGSSRSGKPYLAVNCSALPEGLLESELFGHVKGAFTGAVQNRQGLFERANGGSVFLDEIGDMPVSLQAKLLRVLQEQQFQRLGGSESVRVDVRLIAATNTNLEQAIAEGRFREDLFYRLNVVPIRLPALRDRAEDIPALAAYFVEKICRAEALPVKAITPPALSRLSTYHWPGNVRQLQNVIERAVVTGADEQRIFPADIDLPQFPGAVVPADTGEIDTTKGLDFERTVGMFERKIIEQVMQQTAGNKTRAAALLRLKRTTLSAKLRTMTAA